MKNTIVIPAFVLLLAFSIAAQVPTRTNPDWAFHVINGQLPAEPAGPKTIPNSKRQFTQAQIDDLNNPPDWFPEEHAPAPQIVKYGHGDALACGACHLMSGSGHPESADLTGQTSAYLIQQLEDFRTGARKDSARMNGIVAGLSDEESRKASEWFATLKPQAWTKVVEAAMVPKTFVGAGRMRFVTPNGGMEPIGNRIITLPQEQERATRRDPHSGFIAYVPPGSIAKGEALVKNGGNGRTLSCAICHGDNLMGLGNVPRIAGLHPIYIVRQLYLFKDGFRNGPDAQLMKKPVEKLTDDDVLSISAYVGSLPPVK
ncbi:MAG: cytochrome C [Acidobacteria bacterium]|nr:cytochrome C [Acidobacteriota bacterium]